MKVFVIILVLLASAVALMCVRVIVKRDGKFSSEHIGDSKAMRQRGITCATSNDRKERRAANRKLNLKEL